MSLWPVLCGLCAWPAIDQLLLWGGEGDHGGDPYEQLLLLVFTQKNPARYSPT
jgi:hypothetical protein